MGGGDNELIIKTILDNTGFAKGSKQLMSAIKGLTNSIKSLFGRVVGVASIFGIISKAVSTFMSQNQALTKQMNAAWTALGNALGPIITQIVSWVTKAVSYLVTLMKLLGFTSKTASQASKAAQGAAGGLQRTLAGFDELNKLSSGGGGGAGTLQDVDPTVWMEKFVEAIKGKMWDVVANLIIEKFNGIIEKVRSKAEELGGKIGEYLGGIAHIIARIIKEVKWKDIGETIANFFNGIMENLNGEDLGTILVGKIIIAFNVLVGFLETLNWSELADLLSDILIGALESLTDAIEKADWQKIGEGIKNFFLKLWEKKDEIAGAIRDFLKAVFNAAVDLLCGALGIDEGNKGKVASALELFFGGLLGITVASKLINVTDALSGLLGAGEKASGAAGQVGLLTKAFEGLAALFGTGGALAVAGVAAVSIFSIVDEAVTVNKLGYAEAGLSAEEYAQNLVNLTEAAGETQKEFDELAQYSTDLTMAQNNLDHANIAVINATKQLADSLGLTTDELKAQIEAANGDIMQIEALKQHTGEAAAAADEAARFNNEATQSMSEGYGTLAANVERSTSEISGATESNTSEAAAALSSATSQMTSDVDSSFSQMEGDVALAMSDINSTVDNGFYNAVASASTWGSDLIANFVSGIRAAIPYLADNMAMVAQIVRNYLGFSEPKEGPLSDFHTYGPDMMDLYAKGIQSESAKVYSAVNDVAEGVADGLAQSPMALSAVASGSVVPYGVTGGVETSAAPNDGVSLTEVRDILTEIRNLLGTMEFVAQFGDLRAVAQRITTIQKQMERARG